jgi:replicative DNA helicase
MAEKRAIQSEGEQLEEILEELQREHRVKEISGWETGFADLSRALDGVRPGLHLLIGKPAIGKTAFAKQLLDQIVMRNNAGGVFFTFAESKQELRIKTLARLSHLDSREIRRGSAYLLHWYGVPRLRGAEPGEISPSWEKLRLAAQQAASWLNSVYLVECGVDTTGASIAAQIATIKSNSNGAELMVVIDDCQRLGDRKAPFDARLPIVVEQLQELATRLGLPLLAVWPDLTGNHEFTPQSWAERVASADVIMVMESNAATTKPVTELNQAVLLHIVKNRGGERGTLAFNFQPPFANFVEVIAA